MAITTPLLKIPPSTMRALLWVHAPLTLACPYSFLLTDQERATAPEDPAAVLAPHKSWLAERQLLESDAITPQLRAEWRRAFEALARPKSRLHIIDSSPQKTHRMMFISNGTELVFAMFDRTHCLLSAPTSYAQMIDRLTDAIGPPQDEDVPTPLRLDYRILRVLGALHEAGVNLRSAAPNTSPGLPEAQVERILERLFADQHMGRAMLVDLLADRLLCSDGERIWLHPDFAPWHKAIESTSQLEIQRIDFTEDIPPSELPPVCWLFLGPRGARCLLLPDKDERGELLLARPNHDDLQALLGMFLNAPQQDKSSLQDAQIWTQGKYSFRG